MRTNPKTGEIYVGQAKSDARFAARQGEHDSALGVRHDYQELGRAKPGTDLDVLEETKIREMGGIKETSRGTPKGGTLANKRHQMSDARYKSNGGTTPMPY
ncbi:MULTISPECIES: hypothetical protein [Enterobacterales]|uniref:hypothetical protein n=1 Tax=Enterobacterales TaxID=91347 RepID=UPI002EDA3043